MDDPLLYVRAVHFAATITVAGVVFFAVAVGEPAFRHARNDARAPGIVRSRLAVIAWGGLVLAVLSGAVWLVLTAASMSGQAPADVFSGGVLWTVLSQTEFGNAWLVRCVTACFLAAAFVPFLSAKGAQSGALKAAAAILAAIFVGGLAWSGHGAGGLGREAVVHPPADVLHLVAAAAWLGALVPLALLLQAAMRDRDSLAIARTATLRFSTLGTVSVAALFVSGLVNTWYLVGSIPALLGTDYGRLLIVKIALFFGMVGIAAVNRFSLTPRIVRDANGLVTQRALAQLRRNAVIEAAAGATVVGIVVVLGTMAPASHAAHHHATSGLVPADAAFQHIHSEHGMADVTIEPGRTGTARATIRLLNDDLETLEARQVTLALTAPAAGSNPTMHVALQAPDGSWQVAGIILSQPGNWTVAVAAVLGSGRRLVLEAPIVIEPER